MIEINIDRDYTPIPGGRFAGENFRESILIPKYQEAKSKNEKLLINFDGGYGYPTAFIEEAFGGLKRKLGKELDPNIFTFVSNDEPGIVDKIYTMITADREHIRSLIELSQTTKDADEIIEKYAGLRSISGKLSYIRYIFGAEVFLGDICGDAARDDYWATLATVVNSR